MRRSPFAPPRTIRGSLVGLIAVALVPLVGFGVYEVVRTYEQQRDAEIAASAEIARLVARSFDAFLQALIGAEHAVAVSIARHEHTKPQIEDELEGVQPDFPSVRDMSWLDPRGTVIASTEPQLVGKSFFARDYFQEIHAGADWRVSPLFRSVIDGRPIFVVARGFRRGGQLVGIVAAAVDADRVGAVLAHRSGGGWTALIDNDGTVVAIQPPQKLDWSARRRTADHPWVVGALAGKGSAGIFRAAVNGERRVGALVPIPSVGWAAHASSPFAEAIAPVRGAALIHATVLLAVALGALGTALLVARRIADPLRALEQHAGRLAANGSDPVPVRGPVEVRRVARALHSMAGTIAARQAQLEEVNWAVEAASRAAEQAAAAAAVRSAELEAVIAALPVGLLILDPQREVTRVNDTACEILGIAPGDLRHCSECLGQRLRVLAPDGRALLPAERPFDRALRGEIVRGVVLRVEREGAEIAPVWIAASASPIRDASGAVRGAVATLVDITHLRRLQEERETLMQTVSHDLRTPLHVIVGHAEVLRRRGDEETRRRSDAILGSAGRMTRLIGDLVDAARLEAGHVSLHLEPLELTAFLAGWKERMAGALDTQRVRVEASGAVPVVLADPARVDQILVNLVSNALKYSVAQSEVRVALEASGDALRLSVSDHGPGIERDELQRVFERYYRARTAANAEGMGLGLFITRKLVDAHGWRIEVQSELGKGTVFTVVIPVTGGRARRSTAAA